MEVQIIETKPSDQSVIPLIEELSEYLGKRFGSTGKSSFQEWNDDDTKFVFVKAVVQDEVVGCGAIRPISNEVAELKRMFSKYKRTGIGKKLLNFLEAKAKQVGYKEIWLETRILNKNACNFYSRNNYQIIEKYGKYVNNEKAICFGKKI